MYLVFPLIVDVLPWIAVFAYLLTQSCFLLSYISVISFTITNKLVQKCQYYYTFSDQRVPLVTGTSIVSLLTKQLCLLVKLTFEMKLEFKKCFWAWLIRQNYLFCASQNKSKESSLIQSGNRMSTHGKLIPSEFSLEISYCFQ